MSVRRRAKSASVGTPRTSRIGEGRHRLVNGVDCDTRVDCRIGVDCDERIDCHIGVDCDTRVDCHIGIDCDERIDCLIGVDFHTA